MQKLHFTTAINAPKEKVWNTMLEDATYREWTEAFHKGSYYEGDWSRGSKILFLAQNDDGTTGGMVSRIVENRPYDFVSIEHLGEVVAGVEDTTSERVQAWAGAHENYTFTEAEGVTTVNVDLDVDESSVEMKEMFEGMWPKALEKLKEIAEK